MNIIKQPHGAGGYILRITNTSKGNTRFGEAIAERDKTIFIELKRHPEAYRGRDETRTNKKGFSWHKP